MSYDVIYDNMCVCYVFTFCKIEFDFAHTAADIPPQDNENSTRIISGVHDLV